MMPLDPVQPASSNPKNPMAPPYVDEDPIRDLIEKGLLAAENEMRDAVTAGYEDEAIHSSEPEAGLDDIDYPGSKTGSGDPEPTAIKVTDLPR